MKKLLYLLFAVTLFTACSDDDDDTHDSLNETRWEQKVSDTTYVFQFTINHHCDYIKYTESLTPDTIKYRYILSGNQLLIYKALEESSLANGIMSDGMIKITFDKKKLKLKQVPFVK